MDVVTKRSRVSLRLRRRLACARAEAGREERIVSANEWAADSAASVFDDRAFYAYRRYLGLGLGIT
jgi:hypothetical protein